MSTLSFLGAVNIAVRLVTEQYPDARLYVAVGSQAPGQQPMTNPRDMNSLYVIFGVEKGHVKISSRDGLWGEFGPAVFSPEYWLECVTIPWPIDLDLPKAHALLVGAGYTDPFTAVTLRHPLGPEEGEPLYIFQLPGGFVSVGVNSHKVGPIS